MELNLRPPIKIAPDRCSFTELTRRRFDYTTIFKLVVEKELVLLDVYVLARLPRVRQLRPI